MEKDGCLFEGWDGTKRWEIARIDADEEDYIDKMRD